MDVIEKQKNIRKSGTSALLGAIFLLATAIRQSAMHQVRAVDFVMIYFSGVALGAGLAMIVVSYKMMREIRGSKNI